MKGYPVRMTLPLPILEDFEHYTRKNGTKTRRTPQAAQSAHEQAERQAWRALVLVIRAKLVTARFPKLGGDVARSRIKFVMPLSS